MLYSHQKLGHQECPYVERWMLNFKLFSVRLHRWTGSDDQRAFHDHPWWFLTLCLKGGYRDISPEGEDHLSRGSLRLRKALHQHTVLVDPNGAWTLLLCGREKREWGFWVKGKFRKRNRYFFDHRHHPCER